MSEAADIALVNEPPVPQFKTKPKIGFIFQQAYDLISPYWRSEDKAWAWALTVCSITFRMLIIYLAVRLNEWNGDFYNALQSMDKVVFPSLLARFFTLVMMMVACFVVATFLQDYLSFRWRVWLTKQTLSYWLHNSTFCKLFTYNAKSENPDQRISQDMASFTSLTIRLSFNIVAEFVKSITFAIILWTLSANLLLPWFGGKQFAIPGYMLWFTIIYVSFSTFVIYKFGKPLIGLNYGQEKVEADFRFSLMRIRERRDEVSVLDGSKAEDNFLQKNIQAIVQNYKKIIQRNIYVNAFQNVFLNFSTIVPILAAAPAFFTGAITLGIVMQMATAFNKVEEAMLYFAINFEQFAALKATYNRIIDFRAEMADLKHKIAHQDSHLDLKISSDQRSLLVKDLTIQLPSKQILTTFDFAVQPQEKVLIMGRSGMGKSTLLKCLAGQWPYASGNIERPLQLTIIPQKPYFPISTLRNSILYPNLELDVPDLEIQHALEVCSLENLLDKLDQVSDWQATLSLGEQQRLNFAKLIIAKPSWVVLDEPTASMDKALEAKIFSVLFKELPSLTLLTIGHAPSLQELHTRVILL